MVHWYPVPEDLGLEAMVVSFMWFFGRQPGWAVKLTLPSASQYLSFLQEVGRSLGSASGQGPVRHRWQVRCGCSLALVCCSPEGEGPETHHSIDVRGAISEFAELGLEVTVKLSCKKIAWAITQQ